MEALETVPRIEWLPRLALGAQARSAHALVTREIAMNIFRGVYPQESNLPPENDLIAEFRVSRTALREALKTLAAKGLIESKTKIGTRVLPSSFWNMFDPLVLTWRIDVGVDAELLTRLYEIRQAVEPAAAAIAAGRRTHAHLANMRTFLAAMDRPGHTRFSYAEPDLHFHQEILMASDNPFMQSFTSVIEASILCAFQVSAPIDTAERQLQSIERHAQVLEAIAEGDAGRASAAMSRVIVEGLENAHFALAQNPITISLPLRLDAA